MKIGMIIGVYYGDHVGGAEVQLSYLVEQFLYQGNEVALLHFGDRNVKGPVERKGRFSRYQVKYPWRYIKSLSYLNKGTIYQTLDDMGIDIIYQRGDFQFSDLISSYGRSRGIPVVSALTMEKHCYPEKITLNHMLPFKLVDRFLKHRYYKRSSLILTQTNHQKSLLKKNLNFDSVVIRNAHPIPEPPFIKDDPPLISWVANIKEFKRPFEFLSICKGLEKENIKFIMVGRPNKKDYQERLEKEMAKIPRLEYLGEVRPEVANEIISRSLIFVNTSAMDTEGFSNTYIQSWMRETAVVSLCNDPDDLMLKNGIGFNVGTTKAAVKTIKELLSDRQRLKSITSAARAYAIDNHDIMKVYRTYLEIFSKEIEKLKRE